MTMTIELFALLWLIILMLCYKQIKSNMQEIILDLIYIIITPIGLIYRLWVIITQYLQKRILKQ